eukprot:m.398622 g.398622  ORF g.398622 m.398622 type:complete len:643 (+) comp20110_c0_seq3:105-2033(+)
MSDSSSFDVLGDGAGVTEQLSQLQLADTTPTPTESATPSATPSAAPSERQTETVPSTATTNSGTEAPGTIPSSADQLPSQDNTAADAAEELQLYPPYASALAAGDTRRTAVIPRLKKDVLPSLLATLDGTNPSNEEVPEELTAFVDYFSAYSSFCDAEQQQWFSSASSLAVPCMKIITAPGVSKPLLKISLRLVYILARLKTAFETLQALGIYDRLLSVIGSYAEDTEVLTGVMLSLGNLSFQVSDLSMLTTEYPFPTKTLELLRKHTTSAQLVEAGIWALANLFYFDAVYPTEAVDLIVACIRQHPSNVPIVCEACYALYNLSCSSDRRFHHRMLEQGLVELLCQGLVEMRTTQYFAPALDLLHNLVRAEGIVLLLHHFDQFITVVRPDLPFEEHSFGCSSSFQPKDEIHTVVWKILLRVVMFLPFFPDVPTRFEAKGTSALVIQGEPGVPSLQELAGRVVAAQLQELDADETEVDVSRDEGNRACPSPATAHGHCSDPATGSPCPEPCRQRPSRQLRARLPRALQHQLAGFTLRCGGCEVPLSRHWQMCAQVGIQFRGTKPDVWLGWYCSSRCRQKATATVEAATTTAETAAASAIAAATAAAVAQATSSNSLAGHQYLAQTQGQLLHQVAEPDIPPPQQ